jgi:hypothetical protein
MTRIRLMLALLPLLALPALACNFITGEGTAEPTADARQEATELIATATAPVEPTATESPVVEDTPTPSQEEPEADPPTAEPQAELPSLAEAIEVYAEMSAQHVEELGHDYGPLPPAGGPHNPVWQNCGVYREELVVEHVLHSLEHGAVWLAYQPELSAEQIRYLEKLAEGHSHVLVSPYPGLASPVVASAWGVQFQTDQVPDERLREFVGTYEFGAQSPEPGVTCQDGVGTPQ